MTNVGKEFKRVDICIYMIFPGDSMVKTLPTNAGDTSSIHGSENPLEEEMAIHSSILTWEIPWTEETGGL